MIGLGQQGSCVDGWNMPIGPCASLGTQGSTNCVDTGAGTSGNCVELGGTQWPEPVMEFGPSIPIGPGTSTGCRKGGTSGNPAGISGPGTMGGCIEGGQFPDHDGGQWPTNCGTQWPHQCAPPGWPTSELGPNIPIGCGAFTISWVGDRCPWSPGAELGQSPTRGRGGSWPSGNRLELGTHSSGGCLELAGQGASGCAPGWHHNNIDEKWPHHNVAGHWPHNDRGPQWPTQCMEFGPGVPIGGCLEGTGWA
jgi:hypothetical protein